MDQTYNQNYTIEEINQVLGVLTKCVKEKNRVILTGSENRDKNTQFILEYQLGTNDIDNILLRLTAEDFCGTLKSEDEKHQGQLLYVFVPEETLNNKNGKSVKVEIYIKFSIEGSKNTPQTVVISLHELEYPITYAFKNVPERKEVSK